MDTEMVCSWQKDMHIFLSILCPQVHYNKTISLSSLEESSMNVSQEVCGPMGRVPQLGSQRRG